MRMNILKAFLRSYMNQIDIKNKSDYFLNIPILIQDGK